MSWLSKLIGTPSDPATEIPNLIKVSPNDPCFCEHEEIRTLIKEWLERRSEPSMQGYDFDLNQFKSYAPFKSEDRHRQSIHVACLVPWLLKLDRAVGEYHSKHGVNSSLQSGWSEIWRSRRLLTGLLNKLLLRKLPLSGETYRAMLHWCAECPSGYLVSDWYPLGTLFTAIEEHTKSSPIPSDHIEPLEKLGKALRFNEVNSPSRKLADRVDALLGRAPEFPLISGEVWANAAIGDLTKVEGPERVSWVGLLQHCKTASGGTPTAKWLKQAEIHLGQLDQGRVCRFLSTWFSLTDKKRAQSALSIREWASCCADEKFGSRRHVFYQQLGGAKQNWKDLETIEEAIRNADDPWAYLRDFQNQPEVRLLFGDVPPTFDLPTSPPVFAPVEDLLIIPPHMDLLVGLSWVGGLLKDPAVTRALGSLAVSMYRKVPGIGPRAVRVGNACIVALGMIGDSAALGQLALLKVKVKFGGAQAAIDKAMTKLADKLGISREDLEEMSVPAYGMTGVGRLEQAIGDYTAELSVIDSRSTALVWLRADGKAQKSMPASLKQEHGVDVKELMAAKKDIEKMLPAVAERLDALYLRRKNWPLQIWRERYLDHPLTGSLARRLIWNFTTDGMTTPGVWLNDSLVDRLAHPLALDEKETTVTLWHPLHQESTVVLGWRGFLEEWEIVQPFKQAHREIYLLTPPEVTTRTYSNRFAAHLLKQHQFNALCAARGWKNRLRLMVDDEYPPATRRLPQWGLRAEFWIEGAGSEYGTDTLDSGAYRYVTTDQVRFYQENDPQVSAHAGGGGYGPSYHQQTIDPIPLADVDPLVFSEIMRDVDLFVGVASVGNDPNWLDGGHTAQQRQYWGEVSFGELGASAQTRKVLLERLIPKLKIASACSFEDRFLIVQGKRHAYKIHLGSGNILIKPQDKYLCIVPAQSQVDKDGGKLFLPFEGDRTLSVIISKAFLLAADDKITDRTILAQLQ